MSCHSIDLDTYPRKSHFEYFRGLAYPYVGLTSNVDITGLAQKIQQKKLPFFLTVCYCVCRAANQVPQLRQRIRGGGIVEYDLCPTSHTVALPDGTYCYCTLPAGLPFCDYLPCAVQRQAAAAQRQGLAEDPQEAADKFFISTLPWLSYTALVQPVPMPADSNPRFTWGRYFAQGNRVLMPVSVLCHHALVDGVHIARFYQLLGQEMAELVAAL